MNQLLQDVLKIAHDAGDKIMEIYAQDFSDGIDYKADDSPLTQADLAAHRCIAAGLAALTPDTPILSEEGDKTPFSTRSTWNKYWLVDPLDGTKEFIRKNDEFTVNIALVEDGVATLSVVYAPALSKSWLAAQGHGAYAQENGQDAVAIKTRSMDGVETAKFLVSRSHQTPELAAFLEKAPKHEPVSAGSSLKFCMVAEGNADLYPRLGLTCEWDTAAGQCIVEQAGGRVVKTDFSPLLYNQKDELLNPYFVVIGDPDFNWQQYF